MKWKIWYQGRLHRDVSEYIQNFTVACINVHNPDTGNVNTLEPAYNASIITCVIYGPIFLTLINFKPCMDK